MFVESVLGIVNIIYFVHANVVHKKKYKKSSEELKFLVTKNKLVLLYHDSRHEYVHPWVLKLNSSESVFIDHSVIH